MTSSQREQPPSHRIYLASQSNAERLDLERQILAAAFKTSFEAGDSDAAALAHKGLCAIIQQQLFAGDGSSSGSVIPASVWENAAAAIEENAVTAEQIVADSFEETQELPAARVENKLTQPAKDAPATPMTYLDFGGDENDGQASPAQPAAAAVPPGVPAPPGAPGAVPPPTPPAQPVPEPAAASGAPMTPSQLIRTQSFYQIIGVSQVASFEEIHTRYLKLMRKLLRSRYAAETSITDMREFREVLRAVCVAHDILKDPVTRADYDLRQIGMRNDGQLETPVDTAVPVQTTRTRLMLGELLECAQVLEPAELQIALDMHKAEPGIQFGEFLVSANFLSQEELDSALLAQKLISMGKITVNQFRTAMYRMRDDGTSFFDTLMIEGWLSPSDIFDESSDLWSTGTDNSSATQAAPALEPPTSEHEQNGKAPADETTDKIAESAPDIVASDNNGGDQTALEAPDSVPDFSGHNIEEPAAVAAKTPKNND